MLFPERGQGLAVRLLEYLDATQRNRRRRRHLDEASVTARKALAVAQSIESATDDNPRGSELSVAAIVDPSGDA